MTLSNDPYGGPPKSWKGKTIDFLIVLVVALLLLFITGREVIMQIPMDIGYEKVQ